MGEESGLLEESVGLFLELFSALGRQILCTQRLNLLDHAGRHSTVQMRGAGELSTQGSEKVLTLLPRGNPGHNLGITQRHQDFEGGTHRSCKIGGFEVRKILPRAEGLCLLS